MRNCIDCDTTVVAEVGDVENYMVWEDIWPAVHGFLCVACLESRLGRPLTGADLDISLPINYPGVQRDTSQLFRLKSEAWSGVAS